MKKKRFIMLLISSPGKLYYLDKKKAKDCLNNLVLMLL